MQQQMQEMQKKLDALTKQPAPPPVVQPVPVAPPPAGTGPAVAKEAPKEPKFEKFLSGFYGTLDVSVDYTTKGMDGFVAYHYNPVDPTDPNSPNVRGSAKNGGAGPVGNVGYQLALSTNKSVLGYRGSHKITGHRRSTSSISSKCSRDYHCAGSERRIHLAVECHQGCHRLRRHASSVLGAIAGAS